MQRTARKILLLTAGGRLWEVGQEVKTLEATGSSKQSLPYEWTREDTARGAGSIPALSSRWSISSMADVQGSALRPGSIPGAPLGE